MTDAKIDQCAAADDEQERMDVIASHDMSGLEDDPQLIAITQFAAHLCDAPMCLVSIVEIDRQRFLARTGLDARETARDVSFCAHAMLDRDILVVPDATLDPRFKDNALVTSGLEIRFYTGAPLLSEEGLPLGALCVIDPVVREGLTPLQLEGLAILAKQVSSILMERRTARSTGRRFDEQEQRFRTLADTMPQMVWSTQPDGFHDYYNARWYEFTGVPAGSTDGEGWAGMFHPDDQDRAWDVWRHSLDTGEPYEIEYRLRNAAGEYRWTLGRALPIRDGNGRITRWFGTCTDIHDSRMLQEQREIISHELSHRIQNIFSVIGGLVGLSSRHDPAMAPLAEDLRGRIAALGRAHDFVRPHSERSRPSRMQDSLSGLVETLLTPYETNGEKRVLITGEEIEIDDRSATPLALLFHELATNSAKYGALSVDSGTVQINFARQDDEFLIRWTESGGPTVSAPSREGFGSKLIEISIARQLNGKLEREWNPEGLIVTALIPDSVLSRQS